MPAGELAVLGSAFVFSLTSVVQKTLVVRFKPITLGALSSFGGGIFAICLVLILGKMEELTSSDLGYLFLGIAGGVLNLGLGEPLFMVFIRVVDISKAQPMVTGLMSIFSVMSGIFILGESPSAKAIAGILVVISGTYLLSFSQRKASDPKQAVMLGFRGIALLCVVCTFWTSGLTMQGIALRRVDPVVVNMCRLFAASLFLTMMARAGVNELLVPGQQQRGRMQIIRQIAGQYMSARPWGDLATWRKSFWEFASRPQAVITQKLGFSGGRSSSPRGSPEPLSVARTRSGARGRTFSWIMLAPVANGSISLGVGSLLFLVGINKAGLAVASVLGTTQLFWVSALSVLVLKEKLNKKAVGGIALMFAGVALIVV